MPWVRSTCVLLVLAVFDSSHQGSDVQEPTLGCRTGPTPSTWRTPTTSPYMLSLSHSPSFIFGLTRRLPRPPCAGARRVRALLHGQARTRLLQGPARHLPLRGALALRVLRVVPCAACCASLLSSAALRCFPAALALRYPLDRDLARGHERQRLQLRSV